jgi:hypothetical protein
VHRPGDGKAGGQLAARVGHGFARQEIPLT